jgi:hypothetical protein
MLLRFLLDFADTPKLRHQFAIDPERVVREYGLGPEAVAAWKAGDKARMVKLVSAEAASLLDAPPAIHVQMPWWSPVKPDVRSINPDRCYASQQTEFSIQGTLFEDGATVQFVSPIGTIDAHVSSVPEQTKIVCTATVKNAGLYDVVVKNPSSDDKGVLPEGLNVLDKA